MYTVKLNDGSVIGGLKLKGNILMREEPMTEEMFRGKLSPVTITGTNGADESGDEAGLAGTHEAMTVCYVREINGEYGVALADIDPVELRLARLEGNAEYIAMMTGVEL